MSKSEDDVIVNRMQDELSSSGLAAVQVQGVREAGKLVFKLSGPSDEDVKRAEKLLEDWNLGFARIAERYGRPEGTGSKSIIE